MDIERERIRRVLLERLAKIEFHKWYQHSFDFSEWLIDHFRPIRCEMKNMKIDGSIELCKLDFFHEGDHVFDSSISAPEWAKVGDAQ